MGAVSRLEVTFFVRRLSWFVGHLVATVALGLLNRRLG
jgi:hypothetical protein